MTHREHPAFTIAEHLVAKHHFIWDAIPRFILFHGELPELAQLRPYDAYIVGRAGGEDILRRFAVALRDLVRVTDFEGFYKGHAEFYSSIVQDVAAKFQGQQLIRTLAEFFGWNLASYQVILAPGMYPGGGYGLHFPTNGNFHSYEIIRVDGIRDGKPYFGSAEGIYDLALHEFAHSYVDLLTEQYASDIESLKPLYQHIESQLTRNVTHDWQVKFTEQIIHAFQLFIQRDIFEQSWMEKQIAVCERNGLYLTRQLVELYANYARNRSLYPSFGSFYPEIIACYRNTAMKKDV